MAGKTKDKCLICGSNKPDAEALFIQGITNPVGILYRICIQHMKEAGWSGQVEARLKKRIKTMKGGIPATGHYLQVCKPQGIIPI